MKNTLEQNAYAHRQRMYTVGENERSSVIQMPLDARESSSFILDFLLKAAFTPDRCSRIQVLSSVLLADIQVDTCSRDDNFVADTGYMYRLRQGIQLVSGLSDINALMTVP